jgi:hypothetical protein
MDSVAREWFLKAISLKPGEEMFIPCSSLRDAKKMATALNHCKQNWMKFNTIKAMSVVITPVNRFKKSWVMVKLNPILSDIVFIKGREGVTEVQTVVGLVSERQRKIQMMISDGLTREEVKEMLGYLTEQEDKLFSIS